MSSIVFQPGNFLKCPNKHLLEGKNPITQILFLWICDFADPKTGKCFPSIPKLAKKCGVSERSIQNHLKTLVELGCLKVEHRSSEKNNVSNLYTVISTESNGGGAGDAPPGAGDAPPGAGDAPPLVQEMRPKSTQLEVNPIKSLNKPKGLLSSDKKEIQELFDFYIKVSDRQKVILNPKRRKAIENRLKDFGYEDIRRAWATMAVCSFLRGDNKNNIDYFTIDYALRSDRIEHYLNIYFTKHHQ